jgi:hypothetical protein
VPNTEANGARECVLPVLGNVDGDLKGSRHGPAKAVVRFDAPPPAYAINCTVQTAVCRLSQRQSVRLLDQVFDDPRAAADGMARASKTFDF